MSYPHQFSNILISQYLNKWIRNHILNKYLCQATLFRQLAMHKILRCKEISRAAEESSAALKKQYQLFLVRRELACSLVPFNKVIPGKEEE